MSGVILGIEDRKGKEPGPLEGWIIASAGVRMYIGKEAAFIGEMRELSPVYSFSQAFIESNGRIAGSRLLVGPVLGIPSADRVRIIPDTVVDCGALSVEDQETLQKHVERAEQMRADGRAQGQRRIAVVQDLPR